MFSPPLGTPGGPALSPRCGASSPRWSHHPPPGWSSASSVSSYDSHRPAAASPPPPSPPRVAVPPTAPVGPLPPLAPPRPALQFPADVGGGGTVPRRPRPSAEYVWSPPPALLPPPVSTLASPSCSTDSVLIDFAQEAPTAAAAWRSHQVIKGEEEGDEEDEITAVVRRPPVSAPPAATAATLDEWTCELWEDDPFARFNGRSPAACTGRPRRSVVASSSVPSPVAAALLTPTPAEAVLADAHREVASQVDVLQAVRSTWVSLMYMAAGQAAP